MPFYLGKLKVKYEIKMLSTAILLGSYRGKKVAMAKYCQDWFQLINNMECVP